MINFCALRILVSFWLPPEVTLPVLSDERYIPEFHMEIMQQDVWCNPGMGACVQFAWALLLRSCSQWTNLVPAVEVLEEDEGMLDLAVEGNAFSFLRSCVVQAANFHQEVLLCYVNCFCGEHNLTL